MPPYANRARSGYMKKKKARKGRIVYQSRKKTYRKGNLSGTHGINSRMELKFHDEEHASTTSAQNINTDKWGAADPNTHLCFSAIAQGATAQNCIGRMYTIKSLDFNLLFQRPSLTHGGEGSETPPEGGTMDWAIILDTQTNGATFAPNLVYEDSILSQGFQRKMDNITRFKVLKKGSVRMPRGTRGTGTGIDTDYALWEKRVHCFLKVNIPVSRITSDPTGETITTIKDNSIHVIVRKGTTGDWDDVENPLKFWVNCRMRFTG